MRTSVKVLSFLILITLFVAIAFIIGNIYFSNPGNGNPKSDFYILNNKKLYSGAVNISDDQKTAIVIGKLIYVNAKETQVIGRFDFQGSRGDIIVYSPDLPTNLVFQNSQNISPSQINPKIQSQGALDSQGKALSTLGKLQGQVVVLTFLLKNEQINKEILKCNSEFVNNLGSAQIPTCTPQTFLISAYKPNFNIFSLISGFVKQLGLLPHLNQNKIDRQTNTLSPTPTVPANPIKNSAALLKAVNSIPIASCPLSYGCKNSKQIGDVVDNYSKNFTGLGFTKTTTQSAILSVLDGTVNQINTVENGEKISIVTITNSSSNLKSTYKFQQTSYSPEVSSGNVTQGQQIGTLNVNSNITYQSKNFYFIFYLQNLNANNYINIEPSSDGKSIILGE